MGVIKSIGEKVDQLRESSVGKAMDTVIEKVDKFLGPSGKAWLANGLDELRQAVSLGTEQVQAGNNPGLWGTITTGEATAERMGQSMDVPGNMDDFRKFAADKAKEAESTMDGRDQGKDHGMEM